MIQDFPNSFMTIAVIITLILGITAFIAFVIALIYGAASIIKDILIKYLRKGFSLSELKNHV